MWQRLWTEKKVWHCDKYDKYEKFPIMSIKYNKQGTNGLQMEDVEILEGDDLSDAVRLYNRLSFESSFRK